MSMLDFRKPKCVVLEYCMSYSGKYKAFYGHHYVDGKLCYDVGAINQETGEITTRHYHDKSCPHPKAEALAYWNKLKQGLKRKPVSEEPDDRKIPMPWERGGYN